MMMITGISEEALEKLPEKDGFRLRGTELTRLEAFSDAAFAFAMTMLVISIGRIPSNYGELVAALKDVPAFAASFYVMMGFWMGHRTWSQRYGLEDALSTFLSLALVFVVLVYLYPLKIVFSAFFTWMSNGWLPSQFKLQALGELQGIFAIYGFGLFVLAGTLAALYLRALKTASFLSLNKAEIVMTSAALASWSVMAMTGLISAMVAWLAPLQIAVFAGFVYFTFVFSMPLTAAIYRKKLKLLNLD